LSINYLAEEGSLLLITFYNTAGITRDIIENVHHRQSNILIGVRSSFIVLDKGGRAMLIGDRSTKLTNFNGLLCGGDGEQKGLNELVDLPLKTASLEP
jgi:hypothetical protein